MGRTIPKVTMSSEHNNNNNNDHHETCSRRHVLLASSGSSAAFFALSAQTSSALAAPSSRPPPGYRSYRDKLDGYTFFYPSAWVPVTSAGADIFYRSTEDPEECVFVDVTSPSSSKYDSVRDLGTPREAADFVNQKLLDEFLSTRIGVRRKSDVVNANERTGADGQLYYDVAVRVRSFVDSNPLSPNLEDRQEYQEWDRTMRTTLGVSNGRLYSLRLQSRTAATDETKLDWISRISVDDESNDVLVDAIAGPRARSR